MASRHKPANFFQLKKEAPRFDIETEKDLFDDWKVKWYAFERLSGIVNISDLKIKQTIRLDALRDCFSYPTLRILRNLPLSEPDKEDVDKILAALDKKIKGSTNEIVYIRKFFQRQQRNGESFSDWFMELQDIARKCNFGSCCTAARDSNYATKSCWA